MKLVGRIAYLGGPSATWSLTLGQSPKSATIYRYSIGYAMPIAIAQGSLAIISGALMKGFVSGFSSIHPWLKVLPWPPTVLVGSAMASVGLRGVCSIALRT